MYKNSKKKQVMGPVSILFKLFKKSRFIDILKILNRIFTNYPFNIQHNFNNDDLKITLS